MKKQDAYPSRYFRASDFPDEPLVLEIETARMEEFQNGSKTTEKMVTYFRKQKSGLVCGPVLWDQLIEVTGEEDTDNWRGHHVELFRDMTPFQGKLVACIRVRKPGTPAKAKRSPPKSGKPEFNDSVD
jgi:hypothetical protein